MQTKQPTRSRFLGIPRRLFVFLPGVIAACALSSCAFLQPRADPTRFYVLTVQRAVPADVTEGQVKRWRVGLKPVEVPVYLQTRFMVVRTGSNEIHFAEFDRWAEPLDEGIGRVMRETLNSARNVESVALNSHGKDTLDYEVTIRILACEGVRGENETGSIRFSISWETRSAGTNSTVMKRGAFTAGPAAWDGKDYGQLALGLSEAITGAGKVLAADLPMEAASIKESNREIAKP